MFECVRRSNSHGPNQMKDYDYDSFIAMIKKQIGEKILKMKDHGNEPLSKNYNIGNIQIVCDEARFKKIIDVTSKYPSEYYPFMSFHGTKKPQFVSDIVRNGYLIPGQQHPTKGWTLRMATGNVYGDGIYHSFNFESSKWFSFIDKEDCTVLIVNFVIPGCVAFEKEIKHYFATPNEIGEYCFDGKYYHTMRPLWIILFLVIPKW
jgi:hypothetical protein